MATMAIGNANPDLPCYDDLRMTRIFMVSDCPMDHIMKKLTDVRAVTES